MKDLIRKTAAALCIATCLITVSVANLFALTPFQLPCTDTGCASFAICWANTGCVDFAAGIDCKCVPSPGVNTCYCHAYNEEDSDPIDP